MYSVKTEKRRGDLQARHYGRSLVLHVVVFKPNGAQWDQTIFDAAQELQQKTFFEKYASVDQS